MYFASLEELQAQDAAWQLGEVRALAKVCTADEAGLTLGVATGDREAVAEQLLQKVKVVQAMQQKTAVCCDTQTEHVLNQQSLGLGRVNHILRVHGHLLSQDPGDLGAFDKVSRTTMDRLFPGLTDESHDQAALATSLGGVGWRRAADVALPANLGALVAAAPKIRTMAEAAERAGLLPRALLGQLLAEQVGGAAAAYLASLDELERVKAEDFLRKAESAAVEQWQRLQGGGAEAGGAPRADVSYTGEEEWQPGPDAAEPASADSEVRERRLTPSYLQKELVRLADCTRLRALEASLRQQGNWEQLERLQDLRHPGVSHRWLWHLDSRSGAVLAEEDYVLGVQKRLGGRVHEGCAPCRLCGAPLDPQLEHSEVCGTAAATRGHYACVRALVEGFRLADPSVTTEPRGLTDTQARPADIFTTAAVPGRSAALDVCVASPSAAMALGDAAEAAFKRKLRHYRDIIPQLDAAGISFRPLVWTAEGRPHPAASRTMHYAARLAATRSGADAGADSFLERWRHEIQVAIQRRRAAMARSVLPAVSAKGAWLLRGTTEQPASSDGRLAPLSSEDWLGDCEVTAV